MAVIVEPREDEVVVVVLTADGFDVWQVDPEDGPRTLVETFRV